MSHAPTVFISAATIDLRYLRDLLAEAFKAAQFRVLVQKESLGAPLGNVRELLVDAIGQSDCVIHLAGTGYGSHATAPFPELPSFRCSWTQFEYYHAHLTGIPVLAFVCAPELSCFEEPEKEDPAEPGLKFRLQVEHKKRVTRGEFHNSPCAALSRTANAPEAKRLHDLVVRVAEAVATLQTRHQQAFAAASAELHGLAAQITRIETGVGSANEKLDAILALLRHQSARPPAAAPIANLLHTIPPPPAGFTGRVADLDALRHLSAAARPGALITGLKGMGGIGKTALALVLAREWAPRFPDAALFLDGRGLAGDAAPSAERLMEQVIRAFHPEAGQLPDDPAQLAATYQGVLHGKKALLLLDNAKDAAQAKPLLPPEGCALIVTSRTGFPLDGIAPHPVGRMTDPEAAELLRASYGKLSPAELAEILRLCAGLPLALRLAAAHLALDAADRQGTADVAAYLAKLGGGRLAGLDADAEEFAETTISETLRLSVEPLPEEERRAWEKLTIFTADFDALAAERIVGAGEQMLSRYLRLSLLEPSGTRRYKLHDLAADYARSRLSAGEFDLLVLDHARHYTAIGDLADTVYIEGAPLAGLTLFDRERAQIEAAFAALEGRDDIASARQIINVVGAIVYVGNLRFSFRQRTAWLTSQLSAACRIGDRKMEGSALGNLGLAYTGSGHLRKSIDCYQQALVIGREIGDRRIEAAALGNLGIAHAELGNAESAISYYEEQLEIAREIGDRRAEGNALGNLGTARADLGDQREAIRHYKQQSKIARDIGDRKGEGNALGNLGSSHAALGEMRKAISCFDQHLGIARELGDLFAQGLVLGNLGIAYAVLGDTSSAIGYYAHSLEFAREIGDRRGEGKALSNLGVAHADLGDARKAIGYHEKHLEIAREIGDRRGEGNALGNLGNAHADLGDARKAAVYFEQRLAIAREIGDCRGEGNALWNSALANDSLGERPEAIRRAEAALAIYETIEDPNAHSRQVKARIPDSTGD